MSRAVGVGYLDAADDQRRADFVPGDLVNAIGQARQLDTTDGASVAVVIFNTDHEQTAIDRQRREVLGQIGVDRRLPDGQLLLEVDPVGFVQEPAGGSLDHVRPGRQPPSSLLGAEVGGAAHGFNHRRFLSLIPAPDMSPRCTEDARRTHAAPPVA